MRLIWKIEIVKSCVWVIAPVSKLRQPARAAAKLSTWHGDPKERDAHLRPVLLSDPFLQYGLAWDPGTPAAPQCFLASLSLLALRSRQLLPIIITN